MNSLNESCLGFNPCDGKGYQWWEFRYTTKQLSVGEYKTAGSLLNIQDIKDREEELEVALLLAEKAELKQSFLHNFFMSTFQISPVELHSLPMIGMNKAHEFLKRKLSRI